MTPTSPRTGDGGLPPRYRCCLTNEGETFRSITFFRLLVLENDMKIYDLSQTSGKYNVTLKFTNNIKF